VLDPLAGDGGLCGTNVLYNQLKREICASVDVSVTPSPDSTSLPCDAVSMTLLFTARPAQLGTVVELPELPHRCGAGWSDDCR
jgi:hypothetical protein